MSKPSDNSSTASANLEALDALLNRAMSELEAALTGVVPGPAASTSKAAESQTESGLAKALTNIVVEIQSAGAGIASRPLPRGSGLEALLQRMDEALLRFERFAKEETRRASHAGANAAEWERNAMLAVRAKDDDLARAALANKAEWLRRQSALSHQAGLLDRQVAALRELSETLRQIAAT